MLACLICKLLEDWGLFASIPLTARSSRSFCRGAKFDINIVFKSNVELDDLGSIQSSHQVHSNLNPISG